MPTLFFSEPTLDDALRGVITELLRSGDHTNPSKGAALELRGVSIKIDNPRSRLSRTVSRGKLFSCLGEFLWYLTKGNDLAFIEYYIPSYATSVGDNTHPTHIVPAGYGPRLFAWDGLNQFENAATILREKRDSRQAVIQIFDRADISPDNQGVPCTCTLQFLLRNDALHMVTYMRSNDAHIGLPHDVFSFTMLQEILAQRLSVELGSYTHMVGSLHLYERDQLAAQTFLTEGWQSTNDPMPNMPPGDPTASLNAVLAAEHAIRSGQSLDLQTYVQLEPYWIDLIRLLQVFRAYRDNNLQGISHLRQHMSSPIYDSYIGEKSIQLSTA